MYIVIEYDWTVNGRIKRKMEKKMGEGGGWEE